MSKTTSIRAMVDGDGRRAVPHGVACALRGVPLYVSSYRGMAKREVLRSALERDEESHRAWIDGIESSARLDGKNLEQPTRVADGLRRLLHFISAVLKDGLLILGASHEHA